MKNWHSVNEPHPADGTEVVLLCWSYYDLPYTTIGVSQYGGWIGNIAATDVTHWKLLSEFDEAIVAVMRARETAINSVFTPKG